MDSFDPQAIPLMINESAVQKVKSLMETEEDTSLQLRVFVTGGGCSGFQYGFMFDKNKNDDDILIMREGIPFVVDSLSAQYLRGGEMVYEESLEGAKFTIKNPNAKTTCGCGSSFAI